MLPRKIELLSPAKDLECGIEAIKHGADAVYIGAAKFSARAAAGNSLDDIRQLCRYAHTFGVRIFVTVNTILRDDELVETEKLIHELYEAGVDALIVQDMAITQMNIPPIPLHASTQMDNTTPEKVEFLHQVGFEQAVLARELTLQEIKRIHQRVPDVALESFVHGALCVSYSGRCYLSSAMTGRSANRGECAQSCRLPYSMVDSEGKVIVEDKHLLSLRDMNRSQDLEAMMRAGISSFKIEGRLKDVSYVKNVTAFYRQRLDEIFARNPEFVRSSAGSHTFSFTPQVEKSFNRGFTNYFLYGHKSGITSFDTPKSRGEEVGSVGEVSRNYFTINGSVQINNGDGLVFFNSRGELEGFRVNRAEGGRIFPAKMPNLKPQTTLYRNADTAFEAILKQNSAERKIGVEIDFHHTESGFSLKMSDETGLSVEVTSDFQKEKAAKPQEDNIRNQLGKLGNTPFEAKEIAVDVAGCFVPSSLLGKMRREATDQLETLRIETHRRNRSKRQAYNPDVAYPLQKLDYTANIYNSKAADFYQSHSVSELEPAFEAQRQKGATLMFTRHCLRYEMGWCPKYQRGKSPFREPYFLIYKSNRLRLEFDCAKCEMRIVGENL